MIRIIKSIKTFLLYGGDNAANPLLLPGRQRGDDVTQKVSAPLLPQPSQQPDLPYACACMSHANKRTTAMPPVAGPVLAGE